MNRILKTLSIVALMITAVSCKKEPLTSENSQKLIGKWRYSHMAISNNLGIFENEAPAYDFTMEFEEKGYITLTENGVATRYRVHHSSDNTGTFAIAHLWTNQYSLRKGQEKFSFKVAYFSSDTIVTEQFPANYIEENGSGNPPTTKVNVFNRVE